MSSGETPYAHSDRSKPPTHADTDTVTYSGASRLASASSTWSENITGRTDSASTPGSLDGYQRTTVAVVPNSPGVAVKSSLSISKSSAYSTHPPPSSSFFVFPTQLPQIDTCARALVLS